MSLKRFAMLSATSYHNQQNFNNDNSNYGKNQTHTSTIIVPTLGPETASKVIYSNKSTLIQLKQSHQQQQQQHEQQSQQIIAPIFLDNNATAATTTTTTLRTIYPSTHLLTHQSLNIEKPSINYSSQHKFGIEKNDAPFLSDIDGDDSSNYRNESDESSDKNQVARPERPPSNTYTSTTYYGSGFGVFHQQNIRSSGGGIALISSSSSSSGHGGGSYSNGINNNVNLLLGGAMLTLIMTILCVVCYCCHRNIKKRTEAAYRQQRQWLESDPNMEIYSVEQCYETSGLFVGDSMDGLATIPALHHEPPPSYDAVLAMQEQQQLLVQQHQHQLLMQQQLLHQQQGPSTNSPPPGYRSSIDINSIMPQGRGSGLTISGSVMSGMEINSLASSSANLRTSNSISPEDVLHNYNDVNGNVTTTGSVATTATPTNNRSAICYLRQKQQRSIAANQISQLNMKKVLQAQSCCSLQRAEVENMWNAAAAALAARSAHLPSNSRASTAASVSSPTLAMSTRKSLQICQNSNSTAPETFGSRYLKQNYYRRGCPLCGKFRYDDSNISISMESNLDSLTGVLTEEALADGRENEAALVHNDNANGGTLRDTCDTDYETRKEQEILEVDEENNIYNETSDDRIHNNNTDIAEQCSCDHMKQSIQVHTPALASLEDLHWQQQVQQKEGELLEETVMVVNDDNANTAAALTATARQSNNHTASNNNNDSATSNELPSTSAAAGTQLLPRSLATATDVTNTSSSTVSTPSTTIDLDCINENGIISLDMSKIIDKTGLPTYDAALKLESSGYV